MKNKETTEKPDFRKQVVMEASENDSKTSISQPNWQQMAGNILLFSEMALLCPVKLLSNSIFLLKDKRRKKDELNLQLLLYPSISAS